ncbi:MAG: hypothetical protein H7245_09115 [Candidatus Saccharibacteria bacterium]|nr:hypothetical protein [Pseudorhodobacter sp.]
MWQGEIQEHVWYEGFVLSAAKIDGNGEAARDFAMVLQEMEASLSLRKIKSSLERLNCSADTKALLMDLAQITFKVGEKIISVGRKVISFALDLVQRFPNTTFGLVVGLTLSVLVSSIPLLGLVLGPLLTPLFLAFGLSMGALADFKDIGVRSRISELEQKFAIISTKA